MLHEQQVKSLVLPVLLQLVAASINDVASINSINDSVAILAMNQYRYPESNHPLPIYGEG